MRKVKQANHPGEYFPEGNQTPHQGNKIFPGNDFNEFKKHEVEQSIPDRFEQQVRKYPDQIAIKTRDRMVDYDTLNGTANRVARSILDKTADEENVICLLLEQGTDIIASIFAALKTGKIYVPLNPRYPAERNAYLLEDSGTHLIVTNNKNLSFARELAKPPVKILNIDQMDTTVSPGNLNLDLSPDTLACILYTSGSTGQPKGVLDNHRNILHNMMIYTNGLHICKDDRMTIFHSCSFGASRLDMYGALLNGAALHLRDLEEEGISNIAPWLIEEEITIYHSTPTIFRHFISTLKGGEKFPRMRILHLGSEPVNVKDVELYQKHFHRGCLFLNRFGTTETGTVRLCFINHKTRLEGNHVPAGYAVADTEIIILDENNKEIKSDDIGEIAINSRYLTVGYWKKPQLTQAAFLNDSRDSDRRIYKTGDLGRILADGCLIILGRQDSQVKIKGYRVEIPEVETALLKLDIFREVAVIPLKDQYDDNYLAAYLVPIVPPDFNASRLREELKQILPGYMIPSTFVTMDSLPRTPNDKIDRNALPEPGKERPRLDTAYTPPQDDLEEIIISTWQEVLQMDGLGIDDNFFDLGGSSLIMNIVHGKLQETLDMTIPLIQLYEYPTVDSLAEYLESLKDQSDPEP